MDFLSKNNRNRPQIVAGFSAETTNLIKNSSQKMNEGQNKQRFLHVCHHVWIEICIIIVGQVTRENNKYKTDNKSEIQQ